MQCIPFTQTPRSRFPHAPLGRPACFVSKERGKISSRAAEHKLRIRSGRIAGVRVVSTVKTGHNEITLYISMAASTLAAAITTTVRPSGAHRRPGLTLYDQSGDMSWSRPWEITAAIDRVASYGLACSTKGSPSRRRQAGGKARGGRVGGWSSLPWGDARHFTLDHHGHEIEQ